MRVGIVAQPWNTPCHSREGGNLCAQAAKTVSEPTLYSRLRGNDGGSGRAG